METQSVVGTLSMAAFSFYKAFASIFTLAAYDKGLHHFESVKNESMEKIQKIGDTHNLAVQTVASTTDTLLKEIKFSEKEIKGSLDISVSKAPRKRCALKTSRKAKG